MKNYITKTLILGEGDPEQKREEIRHYFHKTFELDEQIYTALKSEEVYYKRADPLRHPLIFYIGHTAVFYINKLILAKIINKRLNPEFESMFAVGVDEMSWDDLNEANYNWPPLSEVMEYRDEVRKLVDSLISTLDLTIPINWESPFWVIMMGIEHQRIHIETSSVLIRQLPLDDVQSYEIGSRCHLDNEPVSNNMIPVKGGEVILGKSFDNTLYGWDNEYGVHGFQVENFAASKFLVSNHEFMEFVNADGYKTQKYWTEEGWNWKQYTKAEYPKFWRKYEDGWKLRLVYEEIHLPWSWPVEINYLEAKAFCNWKAEVIGKPVRLPTEDEWYILYDDHVKADQPWWEKAPGNINLEFYNSPCPVNMFQFGEFYDIIGNVWQWTETPINGFNGFKVHPCYDDFSTPTFDGRHNMIKGGSWISTGNEAIRDSRYAFRRHFFQHAGFRYVISEQKLQEFTDFYEDDKDIIPFCELDYGENYLDTGNFPKNLVEKCVPYIPPKAKALNIGCMTGRASFELAKYADYVYGLDFTARLIKVAEKMKSQGKVKYIVPEENELYSFHENSLEKLNLADTAEKVEFWQADASNLALKFNNYDFILAENILERLYDPANFLKIIYERLNPDGVLILSSTYNWSNEYTEEERRIGGIRKDGEPYYAIDALRELFIDKFQEIKEPEEIPLIFRKNKRHLDYQKAEISFWKKI